MKNKDINDLFKQEILNKDIPESLSKENMIENIKKPTKTPAPLKIKNNIKRKTISSLAACFAVVIIGTLAFFGFSEPNTTISVKTTSPSSYNEVLHVFKQLKRESYKGFAEYFFMYNFKYNSDMLYESAADGAQEAGEVSERKETSETNVQVSGVDEADIIKTYENYIYYTIPNSNILNIVEAYPAENMNVAATIKLNENRQISDFYFKDDFLYIMAYEYKYKDDYYYGAYDSTSGVIAYDISNPSAPFQTDSFWQDGEPLQSRMIDDTLYISSYYYVDIDERINKNNSIPSLYINEEKCDVPAYDITIMPRVKTPAYTVVTAINANDFKDYSTKSILGASDEIYCSNDNMYIFSNIYDYEKYKHTSQIIKISLNKTKLKVLNSAEINGYVINQFAMDEYDGYFRVAITYFDEKKYTDMNKIYVLDKNMKIVGKTTAFGENETIHSVRFNGDIGYAVTFRRTDPLFAFDLSDPKNPKITSALKIPGYSGYLHPISDKLMLGVGREIDEMSQADKGLKVSLFDTSNKNDLREINTIVLQNTYTAEGFNHKSFVINENTKTFFIPVSIMSDSYENYYSDKLGFLAFTVENNKLVLKNKTILPSTESSAFSINRCAFIEDVTYAVTPSSVFAFDKNFKVIDKLNTIETIDSEKEYIELLDDDWE